MAAPHQQYVSLTAILRFGTIGLFALLAMSCGFPALAQTVNGKNSLSVRWAALELNPGLPDDRQLGRLHYLGGLILASEDSRFGGYSGLGVDADGAGLWAMSDRGHWLRLEFSLATDGIPDAVTAATIQPLLGQDGKPLQGLLEADSEGLRLDAAGGAWVSFERKHRLFYYADGPAGGRAPVSIPLPPEISRLPHNSGLESVAILAGSGQAADLLLLAEEPLPGEAGVAPLWLRRGGQWQRYAWPLQGAFRPTDAVKLPGRAAKPGSQDTILVLERDFRWLSGWAARLSLVALPQPAGAGAAGAALQPERLAEWARPYANDNLEAMDIRLGPDGTPWLYLMSDDNQSRSQRTLLLIFRLDIAAQRP